MLETAIDRLAMLHEASPNVFTMQVVAESNGISMAHQKFSPLGRSAGGVLHFHRCLVTKQNMLDRPSLTMGRLRPGRECRGLYARARAQSTGWPGLEMS
jgi:hypothetical protein